MLPIFEEKPLYSKEIDFKWKPFFLQNDEFMRFMIEVSTSQQLSRLLSVYLCVCMFFLHSSVFMCLVPECVLSRLRSKRSDQVRVGRCAHTAWSLSGKWNGFYFMYITIHDSSI